MLKECRAHCPRAVKIRQVGGYLAMYRHQCPISAAQESASVRPLTADGLRSLDERHDRPDQRIVRHAQITRKHGHSGFEIPEPQIDIHGDLPPFLALGLSLAHPCPRSVRCAERGPGQTMLTRIDSARGRFGRSRRFDRRVDRFLCV